MTKFVLPIFILLSIALNAQANIIDQLNPPKKYDCQLIIAAKNVPVDKNTIKFEVSADGASHGGNGNTYTVANNQVYVAADSHWLALQWQKDGKTIAQGLFAMSPMDVAENRVAILYNPDGSEEQVSIGCTALSNP